LVFIAVLDPDIFENIVPLFISIFVSNMRQKFQVSLRSTFYAV